MFGLFDKILGNNDTYSFDELGPLPRGVKVPSYLDDLHNVLNQSFNHHEDTEKKIILRKLCTEAIKYLHDREGFAGKSTDQTLQAIKHPKNTSVQRANKFIDFLLNYAAESSKEDLLNDVYFLYAGKQDFPKGLGNSTYLRNAICDALDSTPEWYRNPMVNPTNYKDYEIPVFSCQSKQHKIIEQNILPKGKERQAKFSSMVLFIMTLKNLKNFPRELTSYILEFVIATDIKAPAGLKSLPTFFCPQPVKPVKLVTFDNEYKDDHEHKDFGEFVLLS